MRPLELAQKYMDIIFSAEDYDQLKYILADDLQFRGPLYSFDTASDYIGAMQANPPTDFKYQILHSYEDDISACLVYRFSKPGVSTIMVQTFDIANNKIKGIRLIFDRHAFKTPYGS